MYEASDVRDVSRVASSTSRGFDGAAYQALKTRVHALKQEQQKVLKVQQSVKEVRSEGSSMGRLSDKLCLLVFAGRECGSVGAALQV